MPLRLVELPAKDSTSALDPLAALSRSAALGSAHAIDTLVLSVTPAMLRAVRGVLGADHLEVEDVLQESAIGLVGALKTFRGESTVLHFACRIAVLTAITARRRLGERGNDRIHISEDLPVPSSESFTHRFGPRGPPSRRLARAHRYAPAAQSEALVLHCVLGFTVEEVADAGQIPPNTVRSRLRLAKEALRERIVADPALREALETAP